MAMYILNKDRSNKIQATIEADAYRLDDGYFTFFKDNKQVYTIKAEAVSTIVRDDS